eukprot:6616507-Prymnesium_polylepis.1
MTGLRAPPTTARAPAHNGGENTLSATDHTCSGAVQSDVRAGGQHTPLLITQYLTKLLMKSHIWP